jgi:TolB protein
MALRVLRGMMGLLLLAQASVASAVLSIEIIGAGEHQIPVAIVPFGGESKLAQTINEVVAGDLQRTGLFRLVDLARRGRLGDRCDSANQWPYRSALSFAGCGQAG